jgi:hypothetical protein
MLPLFQIDPSWYERYWWSEREQRRPRKRLWARAYAAIRRIVSALRNSSHAAADRLRTDQPATGVCRRQAAAPCPGIMIPDDAPTLHRDELI